MKETIKTSRTAGYLEKIFRTLNAHYFDNELEEPIITIQSTPKASKIPAGAGHITINASRPPPKPVICESPMTAASGGASRSRQTL